MARYSTSGAIRSWQFRASDSASDPSLRRHHYGKIEPMGSETSFVWPMVGLVMGCGAAVGLFFLANGLAELLS